MAIFILIYTDKPNSLQLRADTREAHLAYIKGFDGKITLAGPMMNEAGESIGSVIFLEAEDLAQAQAFAAGEPYVKAGLFAEITIRPFKVTVGGFG